MEPTRDCLSLPGADDATLNNPELDEFFAKVMQASEIRRPKPPQHAVVEALRVMERVSAGAGIAEADESSQIDERAATADAAPGEGACGWCGHAGSGVGAQFCAMCGAPLSAEAPTNTATGVGASRRHVHYHFHHYYHGTQASAVQAALESKQNEAPPPSPEPADPNEDPRAHIRRVAESWAQACNTKQLDRVAAFYAPGAVLVTGPNLVVRGTADIRQFFQGALEAGWGDVALYPAFVEQTGNVGLEFGRCLMLVPEGTGRRREQRVYYSIVFVREQDGEFKAAVHSWCGELP